MTDSHAPKHHGIVTPFQRDVLEAIFAIDVAQENFVLVGGTALAEFYFGHRDSKDLDLFGNTPDQVGELARTFAERLPELMPGATATLTKEDAEAFRRLVVTQGSEKPLQVDISLLDPPLFGEIQKVGEINVLSLEDIAVGKVMASHDRTEVRDAVDLYFLNQSGVDLGEARKRAWLRDSGLGQFPLRIVEMLGLAEKNVDEPNIDWPRMVLPLEHAELKKFLRELAQSYDLEIRRDIGPLIPDFGDRTLRPKL